MSLYGRRYKVSFGRKEKTKINKGEGLSIAVNSNPLSGHFLCSTSAKTGDIWNYLVSVQMRQYGEVISIGSKPKLMTQRHIKQALQKYEPDVIYRAIKYASTISRYPYTVSFAIKVFEKDGNEFCRPRENQRTDQRPISTCALWD